MSGSRRVKCEYISRRNHNWMTIRVYETLWSSGDWVADTIEVDEYATIY